MFWKKRKIVDLRDLQRQGKIRIPLKNVIVPTDTRGFVDLSPGSRAVLAYSWLKANKTHSMREKYRLDVINAKKYSRTKEPHRLLFASTKLPRPSACF